MPNFISNKIVLIGSPGEIEAFIQTARGPTDVSLKNYLTELSIVAAVRSGTPVDEAFRDANNRIDELVDRDSGLPLPPSLAINPVSAADFESWAAEIETAAGREVEDDLTKPTHLSLPNLVPIPDEIVAESYHAAGYHWCTANWGVKAGLEAENPATLSCLPDGQTMATFDMVVSVNGPPVEAIKSISERFPGLTALCAWVGEIHAFGSVAYRNGECLVQTQMTEDDLSADCFEFESEGEEDEMRFLLHEKALAALFYEAITEIDLDIEPRPPTP